ncbi:MULTISPECIES: pilus assembly protein [unclassified Brenneria]|uniref:pilus assembly protein n=1 Tax=unclassified Brenneria TaxID=2634434 RepID=UPI0018F0EB0F|nr:pilus assembly protein [Brenneria sp. L3-3C-1]MBJ7222688.1 pilus assembly protein [Brenneria sp. L3-3C-1]MEE3643931.1 pilus assembly protein [Brenneria sp. L3_3C_1]
MKDNSGGRMRRLTHALRVFARQERGAGASLYVLGAMALLVSAAFIVDSSTATGDAAQIKRAADAAALAVGHQALLSGKQNENVSQEQLTELAFDYIRANLGVNSKLAEDITFDKVSLSEGRNGDNYPTYTVTVGFTASPEFLTLASSEQQIHSTVEVVNRSTEVSLILPNTLNEDSANLAVLRRIGNEFAENLIGDSDNVWLALVPHSQSVSVYDNDHSNRIRQWAASGALRPVELTSLFSVGYSGLADARMPDRRAKLLCMYRGLARGENYFWDEAPSGQFNIYYRADIPSNDTNFGIEPYTISWIGPNPDFGQATGVNDTRTLITDRGCPSAALLPLTNDLDKIAERLDEMSRRFNTNYAIALGWAAMALAPEFRGSAGWDLDDDLPKDFDEGNGERIKAIVMLVNSTGQRWFDTDSYNSYVGNPIDGCSVSASEANCNNYAALTTERFANLCASFRARNLKFYMITTGNDEATDEDGAIASASEFRRIAGAGLQSCAEKSSDLTYYNGEDFVASESKIRDRLSDIVDELHQKSSFVRLIE